MIVVTGSPGTGKHSVSDVLSGMLGLPVLDINGIASGAGLAGPGGVDTDLLRGQVRGRDGIAVGHLAPYVVDDPEAAVILRRSPYELERVYGGRGYDRAKISENVAAEILGVVAYEALSRYGEAAVQVDSTGRTAQETAEAAGRCMDGAPGDEVDWLGMVHEAGDIGRFFA
ncbi:MAG: hypothetical protein MPI95_03110 [Nitrosopumilus sp.]|nr:hypothetical protein [Nitrosopumilus sp.]CAI9831904.1 putative adenylate kinase [Nitrosopumilaceae archaeon]MDA7941783.1 hypothetical protein [Nitrosopumilus sp.]MDA7943938.1 hypothetical protein [Nitrosopumilus sp.]MDA7944714.1 hypothetical protein [Nitrosopumilus sp.]